MRAFLIAMTWASPAAADCCPVKDVAGLLRGERDGCHGMGRPSGITWLCHEKRRDGDGIRFIGPNGAVTEGQLAP